MKSKKYGPAVVIKMSIVLMFMIISLIFTSCSYRSGAELASTAKISNQGTDVDSYDVNVKISYSVSIDDKLKGVNPNIIKATRQAIFDYDCSNAKFVHYNGYSINNDIYIFEVNETGDNTWQVKFWEKTHDAKTYDTNGYSFATVQKEKLGSFKGYIMNPGGPDIKGDETY